MAYFIVIYSKYFITFFLFCFLACGIYALRYESTQDQAAVANVQCVFLFLTQFSAYLTIVIRTQRLEYLILYAFLQILTLALPILENLMYPGVSRILMNHICMLLSAGMIVLTRLDINKAVRQLAIAGASFLIGLIVPWVIRKVKSLRKFGWIYAGAGVAALAVVLILGQVTHGSKISYTIGGITFQPSEFVKLLYVFFLACLLVNEPKLKQVILAGIGAGIHVLILVFSKDLGSALIYFVVYVVMITVAAHQAGYLLAGAAAGAVASWAAYRLFSHVQVRFQAWKDPWSVIDNQGYQITQSLFAMSRGGWFGLGIGKGTPNDIPYVETDFIFSAVVEELGLLFGMGIIGTAIVLFLLLMRLAGGLKDGFYRNLLVGIGAAYLFQTFLTVGGGTKFIPLTGVTLPFISYGGSSVMTTILMFSVVQGIYIMRYEEELRLEKQRRKKERQSGKTAETDEAQEE
ncbi:MAG: FtsW/RodA/SpoVE family cell cycle protein [Eubacteriales bacterium]|nr:FtsW/RodA/SpoVE family cell cycle protein [Eubacteriales bacterium]